MGSRDVRRDDTTGESNRGRVRREGGEPSESSSEDEWVLEGTTTHDVEAGFGRRALAGRGASTSGTRSTDTHTSSSTRETHGARSREWLGGSRGKRVATKDELTPILKPSRFTVMTSEHDLGTNSSDDDVYDTSALPTPRAPKTRARVVLGATLVLGTACVLAASLVTAGSNHADIADAVRNFPTKFSSARQTPALMRRRRQQANSLDFMQTKPAPLAWSTAWTRTSAFHSDSATTQHRVWGKESEGDGDKNGNDTPNSNAFQSDESVPTAARAGLHVLGALGGDSGGAAGGAAGGTTDGRLKTPTKNTGDAERRAGAITPIRETPLLGRTFSAGDGRDETLETYETSSLLEMDDLFFPALGDGVPEPSVDKQSDETGERTPNPEVTQDGRKYLIGLTTSAGFGDQFKRISTYAAMARELNRTLVVWPVFASPHYDLGGGLGDATRTKKPLLFDDYVRISGDGATDTVDRLISWKDVSLPQRVKDFPQLFPDECLTSNIGDVDVQFLTSADLTKAVVARGGEYKSYETIVAELRKMEIESSLSSPQKRKETLCIASTFGDADYNKARHGETANAWRSLDFRPLGRFHHWWANAVDSMALNVVTSKGGSGGKASGGLNLETNGAAQDATEGGNTPQDDTEGVNTQTSYRPTPPAFKISDRYTALHWRRGDKCGVRSKRQKEKKKAAHEFDAKRSGAFDALLCDWDAYKNAPVLDLCVPLAPMYVATDDQDPEFLAHLKSKGCLVAADLVISKPTSVALGAGTGSTSRESTSNVTTSRETRTTETHNAALATAGHHSPVPQKKFTDLDDVDSVMLDVMLVAGAEVSFTFGHTALARLYDRMRMSRRAPRSINVAADAVAFRRAYAAATAGAGATGAAAAALGNNADELAA